MEEITHWLEITDKQEIITLLAVASAAGLIISLIVHRLLREPFLGLQISLLVALLLYPNIFSYVFMLIRIGDGHEVVQWQSDHYNFYITFFAPFPMCVLVAFVFAIFRTIAGKIPSLPTTTKPKKITAFQIIGWVISVILGTAWFLAVGRKISDEGAGAGFIVLLISTAYGLAGSAIAFIVLSALTCFGKGSANEEVDTIQQKLDE